MKNLKTVFPVAKFDNSPAVSFRQWQAWMSFPSTCTPHLPKTLQILPSNKSLGIETGIPATCKHSRLAYCTLAQHCHFVSVGWLTSFWFTFLNIATPASTFFICVTRSLISDVSTFMSEFISDSSCSTNLIKSGLFKPFNVFSVWKIGKRTF